MVQANPSHRLPDDILQFLGDGHVVGLDDTVRAKFEGLVRWFNGQGRVIVALSGGVDSSVVTAVAKMVLDDKAVAVTVKSLTLPPSDLDTAIKVVGFIGIRHIIIEHDELSNPRVAENPPDRCYFCRSELVSALKRIASSESVETLIDGTNADDLKAHRPGVLAMQEGGVRSPLAENDFTKMEVRAIARALHLPNSEKPSNACLASRFPYGQRITSEGLKRVAESEEIVKELTGVTQIRVRDHGDIVRIEVGKDERKRFFNEELLNMVVERLKPLGFTYITLDLEGYRSGSMDETLCRKIIPLRLFSEAVNKG